jgi:hypothetical protein
MNCEIVTPGLIDEFSIYETSFDKWFIIFYDLWFMIYDLWLMIYDFCFMI